MVELVLWSSHTYRLHAYNGSTPISTISEGEFIKTMKQYSSMERIRGMSPLIFVSICFWDDILIKARRLPVWVLCSSFLWLLFRFVYVKNELGTPSNDHINGFNACGIEVMRMRKLICKSWKSWREFCALFFNQFWSTYCGGHISVLKWHFWGNLSWLSWWNMSVLRMSLRWKWWRIMLIEWFICIGYLFHFIPFSFHGTRNCIHV